jgi:hypothetical protein
MKDYLTKKIGQIELINKKFGMNIDPKWAEITNPSKKQSNIIRLASQLQYSIDSFSKKHGHEPMLAPASKAGTESILRDLTKQLKIESFLMDNGYYLEICDISKNFNKLVTVYSPSRTPIASAEFGAPPGIQKIVRFDDGENQFLDHYLHVYHMDSDCPETKYIDLGKSIEDDSKLKPLWDVISKLRFIEGWEDLPDLDIAQVDGVDVYNIDSLNSSFLMDHIKNDQISAESIKKCINELLNKDTINELSTERFGEHSF